MKKILLFILPLSIYAVDLHPQEACETLKASLMQDVNSAYIYSEDIDYNIGQNSNYIQFNRDSNIALENYANSSSSMNAQDKASVASIARANQANLNMMDWQLSLATIDNLHIRDNLDTISNSVYSINCTACPVDGSAEDCCDFTEIITAIDAVNSTATAIDSKLQTIQSVVTRIETSIASISNQVAYSNFLLDHGFGDVTNSLNFIVGDTYTYWDYMLGDIFNVHYPISIDGGENFEYGDFDVDTSMLDPTYLEAFGYSGYNLMLGFYSFLAQYGTLNWHWMFQEKTFPSFSNAVTNNLNSIAFSLGVVTNQIAELSDATTNFFSFFYQSTATAEGVLRDYTNEDADGSYFDFLTNYYLTVNNGGSLSGNMVDKTNWFYRVEALLAALVFQDGSSSNAYDQAAESVTNEYNDVADDFEQKIDDVKGSLDEQIELVSEIEQSMYQTLTQLSKAFSEASAPSYVRLLYVYKGQYETASKAKSSFSDAVDVTVQVDGKLLDFIEIIRSCTTLCWVFLGLWFMFKFAVWTVKKIYMLIRYIIDFFNMLTGGK